MSSSHANADDWNPGPADIAGAQVTALAQALGEPDYDSLLRLSLEDPARYWETVVDHLGIVWAQRPEGYVDLERGPEFPRWFPGGRLNWTDSVLRFAGDESTAGRTAVIAENEAGAISRVTYAELAERVGSLSAALRARGLTCGDRVGLYMENGVEATVTLLALAHAGLVVVPLFSGFGADAMVSRLESCGARGLISSAGFDRRGKRLDLQPTVREVLARVPSIEILVLKDGDGSLDAHDLHALMSEPAADRASAVMDANDPFMVIFTSGTTGKPKGAVHTHGGFPLKIAHDALVHFDVDSEAVFCWPADMGWIAGSLVLSTALLRGATLVCYDGAPDFPDWSRLSRIVERHGVTHLGSAPTLIRGLANHEAEALAGDRSTLRLLITAGEAIDREHFSWFRGVFGEGRVPLINYTGGTEVSGGLLSSVLVRPIAAGAFNTVSPGVDAFVSDGAGGRLVDQPGELAIGAPFVGMTQSFWQDDERYLASYWERVPGTWVHGDLAIQRESGDFLMLGRSDDTIKVAGKRLGPGEVEDVLISLPEIADVAVIGVPDPLKGQHVVVFAVMAADWDGDEEALRAEVRRRIDASLGKAFRPGELHIVGDLPKTRSSKTMRRVIRSAYTHAPVGDLSSLSNPEAVAEIERTAPSAE